MAARSLERYSTEEDDEKLLLDIQVRRRLANNPYRQEFEYLRKNVDYSEFADYKRDAEPLWYGFHNIHGAMKRGEFDEDLIDLSEPHDRVALVFYMHFPERIDGKILVGENEQENFREYLKTYLRMENNERFLPRIATYVYGDYPLERIWMDHFKIQDGPGRLTKRALPTRDRIESALRMTNGNVSAAVKFLRSR